MPPTMTIAKIVSEIEKPNRPGVASCRKPVSSAPANPAMADVMPNTTTLARNTFLPSDSTARSSSRMPFEHPSVRRLADPPAQEPDDGHGHERVG